MHRLTVTIAVNSNNCDNTCTICN